MIYPGDLPPRVRQKLAEAFTMTARTLSAAGMRLVLPDSIYAGQTAWPEDSPLSEPELRAEVQAIVNDAKVLEERVGALRERARELYERLPQTPLAEGELDLPQSIYYALADALSCVINDGLDELSYLERKLADTPESLRADWLSYHVGQCVEPFRAPEFAEELERLMAVLSREDAGGKSPQRRDCRTDRINRRPDRRRTEIHEEAHND